jgi:LysM repeat protein
MASRASGTYKVSPGDTLWGIANKHRMTVNELAALNGLSATAPLKEKQTLQVISGAATNASSAWYTVQRGDSLYSIGKRFAVPTKTLAAWNCLTGGGTIFPGQRISVAEPGAGTNCTNRG